MTPNKINLAILSPAQNAYSETFIQAQKKYVDANVYYYYNGLIPQYLENKGPINPLIIKGINKLRGHLKKDVYLSEKIALKKSLKKNKIQVVLAQYANLAEEVLPICKSLNLPLIVHFHGFDASINKVIEQYNNYNGIFNYATSIIVVSNAMKVKLMSLGCPESKLILNPCAPNDEFLKVNASLKEEQFIAVGRFTDKKAPYYNILAFKEVIKKYPKAKLIIAGDGVLKNTCINLIKVLNLENNIKLPGVITPEEYRDYLTSSRAFVQHSVTAENGDMEGTPVSIVEASAAGLPVVSTNHAGIPDVIIHNKTGLLVDEHDISGMANHMIELLDNPEKAKILGSAGKINISENFNMTQHIDKINVLIKEALTK